MTFIDRPRDSLAAIGHRTIVVTTRPFVGAAASAARRGLGLERRVVAQVLDVPEPEGVLQATLDSPRVQRTIAAVLDSEGARQLVALFFDSGLFDEVVDRLLASDALWRLIDEVAASPAVTAAVTQQGLGFADQFGDAVRTRSRRADDWLEQRARRLVRRRQQASAVQAPVEG